MSPISVHCTLEIFDTLIKFLSYLILATSFKFVMPMNLELASADSSMRDVDLFVASRCWKSARYI